MFSQSQRRGAAAPLARLCVNLHPQAEANYCTEEWNRPTKQHVITAVTVHGHEYRGRS